jgi:hypothetical protein
MFTFPKHHFDPGFIFAGFVSLHCIFSICLVDKIMRATVLMLQGVFQSLPATIRPVDGGGGAKIQFTHLHTRILIAVLERHF